ncbi:hypothetical protein DB346_12290 [Verrucomicrobia bacterium LW23]|nr:hypothetical protein DB346_12290 [Verrucomicrobia bacterium LW23]
MKRTPFPAPTFVPFDIQSYLEDSGAGETPDVAPARNVPVVEAHQAVLLAQPATAIRNAAEAMADKTLLAAHRAASPEAAGSAVVATEEELRTLLEFLVQAIESGPLHPASLSSEARIWIASHICTGQETILAWQRLLRRLDGTAAATLDTHAYPLLQQRIKETHHILALNRASLAIEAALDEIAAGAAATFAQLQAGDADAEPAVSQDDVRELVTEFLRQFVQIIALGSEAEIRLNLCRGAIEVLAAQLVATEREWHHLFGALELHIGDALEPAAAAPLPPYFQLLTGARQALSGCGSLHRLLGELAGAIEGQLTELFPAPAAVDTQEDAEAELSNPDSLAKPAETSFPWREIVSFLLSDALLQAGGDSGDGPGFCLRWLALQDSTLTREATAVSFDAFSEIILTTLRGTDATEAANPDALAWLEQALGKTGAAIAFVEEERSIGIARVQAIVRGETGAAANLRQGMEVFANTPFMEDDLCLCVHMAQRISALYAGELAARGAWRRWFLATHPAGASREASSWHFARTIISALRGQMRLDWQHRAYWQPHTTAGTACCLLDDLPATVQAAEAALAAGQGTELVPQSMAAMLDAYPVATSPREAANLTLTTLYTLSPVASAAARPAALRLEDVQREWELAGRRLLATPSVPAGLASSWAIAAELAPAAALRSEIWAAAPTLAGRIVSRLSLNFAGLRESEAEAAATRRMLRRLLSRAALALGPDIESRAEFLSTWWAALIEPLLLKRPHGLFRAMCAQIAEAVHLAHGPEAARLVESVLRPVLYGVRTDAQAGEQEPTPFAPLRATFPLYEELRRLPLTGWSAPTGQAAEASAFPDIATFYRTAAPGALAFAIAPETADDAREAANSFLESNVEFLANVLPRGLAYFEWAGCLSAEITQAWSSLAALAPPAAAGTTGVLDRYLAGLILATASLPEISERLRITAYLQAYRDFQRQAIAAVELRSLAVPLAEAAVRRLSDNAGQAKETAEPGAPDPAHYIDPDFLRGAAAAHVRGAADILAGTCETVARLEITRFTLEKLLPQSKLHASLIVPLFRALRDEAAGLPCSPETRRAAATWLAESETAGTHFAALQPVARKVFASHHIPGSAPVFSPLPVEENAWQQAFSTLLAIDAIARGSCGAAGRLSAPALQLIAAASLTLASDNTTKDLPERLAKVSATLESWLSDPAIATAGTAPLPDISGIFAPLEEVLRSITSWKKVAIGLQESVPPIRAVLQRKASEGAAGPNAGTPASAAVSAQQVANLLLTLLRREAPGDGCGTTSWSIPLHHRMLGVELVHALTSLSAEESARISQMIAGIAGEPEGARLTGLCEGLRAGIALGESWNATWALGIDDLRLRVLEYLLAAKG